MNSKFLKVISAILAFVLVISSLPFAMATGNTFDSPLKIEIKTDKSSYSSLEVADFSVKITNIGDNTLENVSTEVLFDKIVPVGRDSEIVKEVDTLASGESVEFSYKAMLDIGSANVNFFEKLIIRIIEFFKGAVSVSDNGFDNGRVMTEETISFTFGKDEVSSNVRVWYETPVTFTLDAYQETTTDVNYSLSGSVSSDDGIDSVSYAVRGESDLSDTETTGYAVISFDTWEANFKLKSGNNYITLIAKTVNGFEKKIEITVYYDIGNITVLPESMVTTDGDVTYYEGVLLIYFNNDVTDEEARAVISNYGGQVLGQNNLLKMYQCKFNTESYEELTELAQTIKGNSKVAEAMVDEIIENAEISVSDPWDGDTSNRDWQDNDVDGSNWGLEAIEIYDVWDNYGTRLSENPTRVGVVDSGFSLSHTEFSNSRDDINVSLVNEDGYNCDLSDHGSHVAGTVAASPNNSNGVTGIVWNADLLLASAGVGVTSLDTALLQDGLTRTVVNGAKVINFSMGRYCDTREEADTSAMNAAAPMVRLLEEGYDFLCVQSAGNDDGWDASLNGWFSSFRTGLSISHLTSRYTMSDLIDRSIIVAAVSNDYSSSRGYRLADYSNHGSKIDIAAPGSGIYSCTWNGYDYMDGTSMAAPHVTAVASLIWSINRDFTAEEIKTLICSSATTTSAYGFYNSNSYRMLNARLAVDEAVRLTDAVGTVYGRFVDAATGSAIDEGTFVIYKDNIQGERYDNVTYSFSNGEFSLDLPSGKYVLAASADGYMVKYATVVVEPFETLSYGDIPMTMTLSDNQMRIVLSWGSEPSDLDSHIVGTTKSGGEFHVAYYDEYYYQDSERLVWLDVDDTSSYGPETVTIMNLDEIEEFTYCIHNYTERYDGEEDSGAFSLSDSYAKIDVYIGDSQVASYDVPTNRKGTVWNVFKMNSNGYITRINTFEYESDPEYVGGRQNNQNYYMETQAFIDTRKEYER